MDPLDMHPNLCTLPVDLVHQEMQKIIADPLFAVSHILKEFLRFVVQETLQGRSNQIKEYTIGLRVLNKPADFNPKQDGIVRIHACRLRLALSRYYAHSGVNDPIRISVPRGCYVPIFTDYSHQENSEPRRATMALNEQPGKLQQTNAPSVAVLAFHHLDQRNATACFAQGLASRLNTELLSLRTVSVVAYYPLRRMAKGILSFKQALREVGATFVIAGDIQYVHSCYRVNIQLIHAQSALQVWSQTFDLQKNPKCRFATQDRLVKEILCGVASRLGLAGKPRTQKVTMAVA